MQNYSNINFQVPLTLHSSSTGLHQTFMDTVGRSVLTLEAHNVVDEFRDRELIVTYSYPFAARFRKPMVIAAGLMAVFIVSYIVGNLNVSIGSGKAVKVKKAE